MARSPRSAQWTTRPSLLVVVAVAVVLLVLAIVADFFAPGHNPFGLSYAFFAAFGFVVGLFTIGVAKSVGWLLRRPDSGGRRGRRPE